MSGSHLVKGSLLTEERLCVHVASVSPLLGISAPVSRLPLGLRLGLVTPVDACLVLTCGSSPEPTLVIHLFIHSIILPHSRIPTTYVLDCLELSHYSGVLLKLSSDFFALCILSELLSFSCGV